MAKRAGRRACQQHRIECCHMDVCHREAMHCVLSAGDAPPCRETYSAISMAMRSLHSMAAYGLSQLFHEAHPNVTESPPELASDAHQLLITVAGDLPCAPSVARRDLTSESKPHVSEPSQRCHMLQAGPKKTGQARKCSGV